MKQNVGEVIKLLRCVNGVKQKELSGKLSVTPAYLSMVEHGKTDIKFEKFIDVCNILNTTPTMAAWIMDSNDSGSAFVSIVDVALGSYYGIKIERDKDGVVTGIHKL